MTTETYKYKLVQFLGSSVLPYYYMHDFYTLCGHLTYTDNKCAVQLRKDKKTNKKERNRKGRKRTVREKSRSKKGK